MRVAASVGLSELSCMLRSRSDGMGVVINMRFWRVMWLDSHFGMYEL